MDAQAEVQREAEAETISLIVGEIQGGAAEARLHEERAALQSEQEGGGRHAAPRLVADREQRLDANAGARGAIARIEDRDAEQQGAVVGLRLATKLVVFGAGRHLTDASDAS